MKSLDAVVKGEKLCMGRDHRAISDRWMYMRVRLNSRRGDVPGQAW